MQVLVGLNKKEIKDYLNYTNSFIIGLKDFSINYLDYSLEEIKKILDDYPHIEIFISVNKNIFNNELEVLEKILIELDRLPIKGVFFYDLSVLSLWKKNNLHFNLVWSGEHMTTNYNTCNYYYQKGCEYAYLSSEITLDEIKEIKENSKIKLISFVFGYPEVSFSKRKLLSNYFEYHNEDKKNEWYRISSDNDNNHSYIIKESSIGTRILYGQVMNGIRPFNELKKTLDYALLNEEFMDHDIFIKGLSVYKDLLDEKIDEEEAFQKIFELTKSNDTVFYYKKTIYKVKR